MTTKPAEFVSDPLIQGEPAANGLTHGPLRPGERPHAAAGSPAEVAPAAAKWQVWPWLLLLAVAGGGWYSRETWLPWVSSLGRSGGGPAAKAARVVPVRTAMVQN